MLFYLLEVPKWTDISDYFPDKKIINRGIGGARLIDLNNYAKDPYHPKQIIIYCGQNDIATDDQADTEVVVKRFKSFYKRIRQEFPKIKVSYISIKHSPRREQFWPKMKEVNKEIAAFMKKEKNIEFIDITKSMEGNKGNIRTELFKEDMLHMTPEGYHIWAQIIKPYINKYFH